MKGKHLAFDIELEEGDELDLICPECLTLYEFGSPLFQCIDCKLPLKFREDLIKEKTNAADQKTDG